MSRARCVVDPGMGQGAVVDERLHTSMTGMDYGSTYHLISCVKCQTALGRMYRTTTPELDLWRGQYTFSSDLLAFYEISAPLQPPAAAPTGAVVPSVAPEAAVAAPGKGRNLEGTAGVLADVEIAKVQKFCLYLYDRIKSLEEALELHRTGSQEGSIRTTTNSTVERPPGKRGRPRKRPPSPQAAGPWAPLKDPAAPNPEKSRPKGTVGSTQPQRTEATASSPAVPSPAVNFTTPTLASAPATPLAVAGGASTTIIAQNGNEQPIKRGRGRPRKHFPPLQVLPPTTTTESAAAAPAAQDAAPPAPAHVPPPPVVEQSPFCPAPV